MSSPLRDQTRFPLAAESRAVIEAIATDGPAWLDGVGQHLARALRSSSGSMLGLDAKTYGTARMRACSPAAERDVVAAIPFPDIFSCPEPIIVETLRSGPVERYVDLGMTFADTSFASSASAREQISAAIDMLAAVPGAARAVGGVLSAIHILTPEGPDYDVSYSDPELPFSIFVGISEETGRNAELRLAEGILHECMHLQLTLIEMAVAMMSGSNDRHFSPWQNTMRPAQGILHGTYVFAVIRDYLNALLDADGCPLGEREYVRRRIETCDGEIAMASREILAGHGLTTEGRILVERLRKHSA